MKAVAALVSLALFGIVAADVSELNRQYLAPFQNGQQGGQGSNSCCGQGPNSQFGQGPNSQFGGQGPNSQFGPQGRSGQFGGQGLNSQFGSQGRSGQFGGQGNLAREYLPPNRNGEPNPGHSLGPDGYRYRGPMGF